jgi:hypothetical protein
VQSGSVEIVDRGFKVAQPLHFGLLLGHRPGGLGLAARSHSIRGRILETAHRKLQFLNVTLHLQRFLLFAGGPEFVELSASPGKLPPQFLRTWLDRFSRSQLPLLSFRSGSEFLSLAHEHFRSLRFSLRFQIPGFLLKALSLFEQCRLVGICRPGRGGGRDDNEGKGGYGGSSKQTAY